MVIVVGAVAGLACSSRPRIMECGSFSLEDYEDEIARFAPSTSIDVGAASSMSTFSTARRSSWKSGRKTASST
ncbi:MAG: hypothetical protein IJW49_01070 [Clostridia bacterium]|nr:hypothetical protein [Clostridia bacterium]